MFVLSLFDKLWHPNLTEAEAVDMMEKGIAEVCVWVCARMLSV